MSSEKIHVKQLQRLCCFLLSLDINLSRSACAESLEETRNSHKFDITKTLNGNETNMNKTRKTVVCDCVEEL
jgi:hypothetical protein